MRQQQRMEEIMMSWVSTCAQVQILTDSFGKESKSARGMQTLKDKQERILKANGFVYRILTELIEGEYKATWLFRQKQIKNMTKVHSNWIKKHIGYDWLSTEMKAIEL